MLFTMPDFYHSFFFTPEKYQSRTQEAALRKKKKVKYNLKGQRLGFSY
jgi:hypothetical protein